MSAIEIKQVMKQKFPKKTDDQISDAFRKVNMGMTQDQRDAKDYRQKIIAGMISILQEAKVKDYYHVEKYSPNQFYVEDAEGGDETGPFKTREEAEKECEKRNKKRLQKESNIDKLLTIFEGNVSDKHQKKIAIDTIKNPDKALLGGPSVKEAEEILRKKFGYTQKQIDQLKEEIEE